MAKYLWAARDKNGRLCVFTDRPYRRIDEFIPREQGNLMVIDRTLLPEITWENSPRQLVSLEDNLEPLSTAEIDWEQRMWATYKELCRDNHNSTCCFIIAKDIVETYKELLEQHTEKEY